MSAPSSLGGATFVPPGCGWSSVPSAGVSPPPGTLRLFLRPSLCPLFPPIAICPLLWGGPFAAPGSGVSGGLGGLWVLQVPELPVLSLPKEPLKAHGRLEPSARPPFIHHRESLWKRCLSAW